MNCTSANQVLIYLLMQLVYREFVAIISGPPSNSFASLPPIIAERTQQSPPKVVVLSAQNVCGMWLRARTKERPFHVSVH